ncbi:MAG: SMC-Scp complex subunit ScpB [bacterium]
MRKLSSLIESILFVSSKPLAIKKISKVLNADCSEVASAIDFLAQKYNDGQSGIVILQNNDEAQMVSNPDNREAAEKFMRAEVSGDLTRPQLETLTVLSYCGPITKPELEQIRGVNCSLIIRNLMLRGMVKESNKNGLFPTYEVTMDYLRHLGIKSLKELPDYSHLHKHPYLESARSENEK